MSICVRVDMNDKKKNSYVWLAFNLCSWTIESICLKWLPFQSLRAGKKKPIRNTNGETPLIPNMSHNTVFLQVYVNKITAIQTYHKWYLFPLPQKFFWRLQFKVILFVWASFYYSAIYNVLIFLLNKFKRDHYTYIYGF